MLKHVVAATAALAIAGSSAVYAQQYFGRAEGPGDRGPGFERNFRPSAEDIKAFTDARIAALRAGLQLTPDQERNWPPFEQAVRDLFKLRLERMQARAAGGEQPPPNPFDRLRRRADSLSQLSTALKRAADNGAPLYQSLNEAQQQRFRILARILRPHWMAGEGREHHGWNGENRRGMMGRHCGGGWHGMMGPERGRSGGMMGRDRDDNERGGMMGPNDGDGPHGMIDRESNEDSDSL